MGCACVHRQPDLIKTTSNTLRQLKRQTNMSRLYTLYYTHTIAHFMQHNASYCIWWGHGKDGLMARGPTDRQKWTACRSKCVQSEGGNQKEMCFSNNSLWHQYHLTSKQHDVLLIQLLVLVLQVMGVMQQGRGTPKISYQWHKIQKCCKLVASPDP